LLPAAPVTRLAAAAAAVPGLARVLAQRD